MIVSLNKVSLLYFSDSFGPIISPQTLVIGVSNTINVTVYSKGPPYIEWLKFNKPVSKFVKIAPPPTTGKLRDKI